LFELTAAAVAATIATVGDSVLGGFAEWVPLASGLIILLPGISLIDSVDELANGHLASGGARMAGVGVTFLALAFGSILGSQVAVYLANPHISAPLRPLPEWSVYPALVVVAAGSMIRFQARPVDFFTGLVGSSVALLAARKGVATLGPLSGPFVAALLLGLTSNIYARIRRQAPELMAIPGIALLVPGSFGVKSLSALLSEDTTKGIDTAFEMFLVAMALVAGLLFSDSLIRERSAK
jgi:uncharacterized membrane protein YjjB (DUF3815 family)